MRTLRDDIAFALRSLHKHPTFTLIALSTLALGIGVTTAVTSVADATLLRKPEVAEPDRLVALWTTCRRGFPKCSTSFPDYRDYRQRSRTLEDLAAYDVRNVNLGSDGSSRLVLAQAATGNYFDLLGVKPAHGRLLTPEDERGTHGPVVVLGHSLWTELGADPDLVGRSLRLNTAVFTVVGVAPPGFRGLHLQGGPDLYVPLAPSEALGLDSELFEERRARWIFQLVGRLAEGITPEVARTEMAEISNRMAEEDAAARGPRKITLEPVRGHIGPSGNEDSLASFVVILMAVAGSTLLIGSANLANLLLARAADRQREIATRLALGAGRARLVRQLLTESLVLSTLGGLVGLLVSQWTLHFFRGFELPGGVRIDTLELAVDGRMLLIALGVSIVTGLLFGSAPAWRSARSDVLGGLAGSRSGEGPTAMRMRHGLVALQIALCLTLLFGAGLFLRTVDNGQSFDLGFRSEGMALASFDLRLLHYDQEAATGFARRLTENVSALPGVESASTATLVPLGTGFNGQFVTVDGYEPGADEEMRVETLYVGDHYFETLRIPRLVGAGFPPGLDSSHAPMVVISRRMAELYWPGASPIGGVVRMGEQAYEVAGVVDDVHWRDLSESSTSYVFFPLSQHPERIAASALTLAVRSSTPARELLPALRHEFRRLDPELSLDRLETMESRVQGILMPQRMGTVLLSILGGLMLLLTALGVYGVVGCTVASRRREIGIRMALGARNAGLIAHVVRGMGRAIGLGIAIGLALSVASARTLESFLFGVAPNDPLLLGSIGALLALVAIFATVLPAGRATRVAPIEALRED